MSPHLGDFLQKSASTLESRSPRIDTFSDVYFLDITTVNPCYMPMKGQKVLILFSSPDVYVPCVNHGIFHDQSSDSHSEAAPIFKPFEQS
jgi:hypothetical protein